MPHTDRGALGAIQGTHVERTHWQTCALRGRSARQALVSALQSCVRRCYDQECRCVCVCVDMTTSDTLVATDAPMMRARGWTGPAPPTGRIVSAPDNSLTEGRMGDGAHIAVGTGHGTRGQSVGRTIQPERSRTRNQQGRVHIKLSSAGSGARRQLGHAAYQASRGYARGSGGGRPPSCQTLHDVDAIMAAR